ncbi:MAG: sulfite oxidase-like oxidoreductase [Allorhizobium sp.]
MTDDMTNGDTKLTTTKRRWAREGRFLTGEVTRPSEHRLPPGQHLVQNWPVLDLGIQPEIPPASWRLSITGAVEHPQGFDWQAFSALPRTDSVSDIHCVTTWSRYDNRWSGVAVADLLDLVLPKDSAAFVALSSYDGYVTNMPLADFASDAAILAHSWNGKTLSREHGGPMRLVVPHLYFWKSPKWLKGIEFLEHDRPGFWEVNGYHNYGDPWREQRYSDD